MKIALDPLKKYTKQSKSWLIEAMGLIPVFISVAENEGREGAKEVMDTMNRVYGFGLGDYNMLDQGGKVSKDGVFTYPEDPDLYPYAQFTLEGGTRVFVYPYGFVCTMDDKNTIMVRMD